MLFDIHELMNKRNTKIMSQITKKDVHEYKKCCQ